MKFGRVMVFASALALAPMLFAQQGGQYGQQQGGNGGWNNGNNGFGQGGNGGGWNGGGALPEPGATTEFALCLALTAGGYMVWRKSQKAKQLES